MKTPHPGLRAALLLSAIVAACLFAAAPVMAAATEQTPALTPEQQRFVDAQDQCIQQFQAEKRPRSQVVTFLRGCYKAHGITKAPPPLPAFHIQLPQPPVTTAK